MTQKPLIRRSPFESKFYLITHYRTEKNGYIVASKRVDITDELKAMVRAYKNELLGKEKP